ncbi:MAG TPA: cation:proton antiporter [Spirochaetota bacterium]|nr:cation:proton antiporter [Spirochaetota bacterium]
MGIAADITIIIVAGVVAGFIAYKLGVPLVIGYIFAGILVGPYTGVIHISEIQQIELLAEIGVALLLFALGIEFTFRELKEIKHIAIFGTILQLVLTIAFGYGIGWYLNLGWIPSVWLGAIMSLSSTMIVLKTLMGQGLIGTLSSKVMIGMLIVQDIAAVPMMIILPQLSNIQEGMSVLGFAVIKAVVFLVCIIYVGTKFIPYILRIIAKWNSRELFLLAVTALGLGIGYATHAVGLSFAFGAFVAGMVLSESEYSHQALSDIIPLRDIFSLIFFTSVGMLIDPAFVIKHAGIIFLLTGLIIVFKGILFSVLARSFGYVNIIPIAVGLGLSQVGEFSFVLARLAVQGEVFARGTYSIILSTIVISMVVSPFLSQLAAPLYSLRKRRFKGEPIMTINFPHEGITSHVVIAGGGRVGRQVAGVLQQLKCPYVIIDQDYRRYEIAKSDGHPIIYGDASQETVLDAAELSSARLLLITIPAITVTRAIVRAIQDRGINIEVVARAASLEQMEELYAENITQVVQPEFEASLEITRQALLHFDVSAVEIQKCLDEVRSTWYSPFYHNEELYSMLTKLKNASSMLEISWFEISDASSAAGKSIGDLKIRSETGASIVGIMRRGDFVPNPEAGFMMETGDLVAVIGTSSQRNCFEQIIAGNNPDNISCRIEAPEMK